MKPTFSEALAGMALCFMGVIGIALLFQVAPKENHDYFLMILSALAGAMGVTGGQKAAQMFSGGSTTVNQPTAAATDVTP